MLKLLDCLKGSGEVVERWGESGGWVVKKVGWRGDWGVGGGDFGVVGGERCGRICTQKLLDLLRWGGGFAGFAHRTTITTNLIRIE